MFTDLLAQPMIANMDNIDSIGKQTRKEVIKNMDERASSRPFSTLTGSLTREELRIEKTRAELEVGDLVTFIGDDHEFIIVEVKDDRIDVELRGCTLPIIPIETVGVDWIDKHTKKREIV